MSDTERTTDREGGHVVGQRLGAWAGLAFVLTMLVFLTTVVLGSPKATDSLEDVRRWFADESATWRGFMPVWFIAQLFFLLPFAATLAGLFRQGRSVEHLWARLSFAGAVIAVAVSVVSDAIWGVLSLGAIEHLADGALDALMTGFWWLVLLPFHLAIGLFAAAASAAILRTGVLPRWLGWLGLALLVPNVVSGLGAASGGFTDLHDAAGAVGVIGTMGLWVAAVSVALLRSTRAPAAPVDPSARGTTRVATEQAAR